MNVAGELRRALRLLWRQPSFVLSAVVPLALGLGATVAMFTIAESVLVRPLRLEDPASLVAIYETNAASSVDRSPVSTDTLLDWRERSRSFTQFAAYEVPAVSLPWGGNATDVPWVNVTPGFFEVLGVDPAIGGPDTSNGYLVSARLWRRRFGADPGVVGRVVDVFGDEYSFRIAGVMPETFSFPPGIETWSISLPMQRSATRGAFRSLWAIARLRRGVTIQAAQADLTSISRQLARDFPRTNAGWTARVVPLSDVVVGQARPPIVALSIVATLLMLIAGVNLVSLLLARALERRREIGIRLALGARSGHLIGILLVESLVVAATAGVIGGVAAWGAVRVAIAVAPALIPRADEISVDLAVLAFAAFLPVLVAFAAAVAGGLPALGRTPEETLRPTASIQGGGRRRLGLIVAGEVALATVLVTAAALGVSSYSRLLATPLGFDRTHVSITRFLPLPSSLRAAQRRLFPGQPPPDGRELFRVWTDEVLEAVIALPGVSGAAVAEYTPFDNREVSERPIRVPGRVNLGSGVAVASAVVTPVTPDYFAVLRVPLLRGRVFSRDDRASTTPVAIVSLAAARRFWSRAEVVGQEVVIGGEKIPRTIVGVVNDVILGTPAEAARPFVYLPFAQFPRPWLGLVVRAALPAEALAPGIRRSLEAGRFRPLETASLDNLFERTVAKPRLVSWTVTACAAIALVVGTSGIFAVLAFSVRQRRREIAVRLAIGASPGRIVGRTLRESAIWMLVGLGVGLPAAAVLSTAATTVLFEVSPIAPQMWLSVIVVLMLAGLAGALVPALRASRVDAMEVLRTE